MKPHKYFYTAYHYVPSFCFLTSQLGMVIMNMNLNRMLMFCFCFVCCHQMLILRLEQESGFFFNMKHFEDQVQAGEWDEIERYLCGFTKVEDNRYSMKIFFEIRKQKYLEALDRWVLNICPLNSLVCALHFNQKYLPATW